jgi:hypothetical protein
VAKETDAMRRVKLLLASAVAVAFALSPASAARADEDAAANAAIARGELVISTTRYEPSDRNHFVGGVSYLVVDLPAEQLSRVARDVSRAGELLPQVESAKLLSIGPTGIARVHLTHKLGVAHGGYTVQMMFTEHGLFGRFWLERTEDSALVDGWGFIRLQPLGPSRTLITYGLLFDLGDGFLRTFFETRIRDAALRYPERLAAAARR